MPGYVRTEEDDDDAALAGLLAFLKAERYRFVTPTPATHARIMSRAGKRQARDLRDVFGWNLPFAPGLLEAGLRGRLVAAGAIAGEGGALRSCLRVSSLAGELFLHSAYPTEGKDAVFLGPDSYRFADLIARALARCLPPPGGRLLDIGTGAGVGAIVAARLCPGLEIVATDVNPAALRLARVNARAAGVAATLHLAGDLAAVPGSFDLVLANPPYLADAAGRDYRDGGGLHGGAVSLAMAAQAVPRLAPGGRFLLYTGSAIVAGEDRLRGHLALLARAEGCTLEYAEIDPDVFGEELETPAYVDVERIALVSAAIARPGANGG